MIAKSGDRQQAPDCECTAASFRSRSEPPLPAIRLLHASSLVQERALPAIRLYSRPLRPRYGLRRLSSARHFPFRQLTFCVIELKCLASAANIAYAGGMPVFAACCPPLAPRCHAAPSAALRQAGVALALRIATAPILRPRAPGSLFYLSSVPAPVPPVRSAHNPRQNKLFSPISGSKKPATSLLQPCYKPATTLLQACY